MQSNELAQAESLEREAQMHRDRAMGGGEYFQLRNSKCRIFIGLSQVTIHYWAAMTAAVSTAKYTLHTLMINLCITTLCQFFSVCR